MSSHNYAPQAPYKGLESFSEQDRLIFFGREKEQETIISYLSTWRLTILSGPSGVGKSSLLRAGVVPYLRRHAQEHQKIHGNPGWAVTILKDWHDPLNTIKRQLKTEINQWFGIEKAPEENESFITTLKFWIEAIRSEEEGGRLYIILDQFDDYLLAKSKEESMPYQTEESFDLIFAQVVNDLDLNVNFLISVRDDFFHQVAYLRSSIQNLYKNLIEIRHLNQPAAKEAICRPIHEYNRQAILLESINQSPLIILSGDRDAHKTTLLQDGIITHLGKQYHCRCHYFNQWYDWNEDKANKFQRDFLILTKEIDNNNNKLLIVIDQFEDYFRKRSDKYQEDGFLKILLEFIKTNQSANVKFLISVNQRLIDPVEWGSIQANLPDPHYLELYKDEQKINRIRWQPKINGVNIIATSSELAIKEIEIASELVADILNDYDKLVQQKDCIDKKGVAAPYLQLIMFQLWESRQLTNGNLTSDTLERLGGAEKIIQNYVDEILNGLNENEKKIAARIFYYLVTPSGASIAQDVQDLTAYLKHDFTKSQETSQDVVRQLLDNLSKDPAKRLFRAVSENGYEVYFAALSKAIVKWQRNYEEKSAIQERDLNQKLIPSVAQKAIIAAERLRNSKERESRDYELASLLALQAYYWNRRNRNSILRQVDQALREVLKIPYQNKPIATQEQTSSVITQDEILEQLKLDSYDNILPKDWMSSVVVATASADGQMFAAGCQDGSIYLQNLQDSSKASQVKILNLPTSLAVNRDEKTAQDEHTVSSISISPDKQKIAVGYRNGFVWVWDVNHLEALPKALSGHTGAVSAIAFNPQGTTLLASSSSDQTVRLWNLEEPNPIVQTVVLKGHQEPIYSVSFSADGKYLTSVSADKQHCWEIAPSEPKILRGHRSEVRAVAYSPDGQWLASASWDNTVHLWNLKQPEISSISLPLAYYGESTIAFDPDSKILVAAGYQQKDRDFYLPPSLRIWDLRHPGDHPTILHAFEGDNRGDVRAVAISPDGKWLAAGGWDRIVRLWYLDRLDKKPIALDQCEGAIRSLAFSNDWKLAAGSAHEWDNQKNIGKNTLRIWDLKQLRDNDYSDLEKIYPKVVEADLGETFSVAFSPLDSKSNEEALASVGKDNALRLWSVNETEFKQPTILGEYNFKGSSVAFSPDGKTIATGSWTGTTWLWNCNDFSTIPITHSYQGNGSQYGQEITSVAFSPNGQLLATASNNTTIQILTVDAQELVKKIQDKLSRNLSQGEWDEYIGDSIPYERTCACFESDEGAPKDAPSASRGLPDVGSTPEQTYSPHQDDFESKLKQLSYEQEKIKILKFIEDRTDWHLDTTEEDVTVSLNKFKGDYDTYLKLETLRWQGFLQIADNGNGPGTIRYRLSPEYQNYRQEHPTLKRVLEEAKFKGRTPHLA